MMKRAMLAAALAAFPLGALADGAGEINDGSLQLTYTSGAYTPNPVIYVSSGAIPACEEGTPLCDVFTLTVSLSDKLRKDNDATGTFEIYVDSSGDFDLYVYDGDGNQVAASANDGGEELFLDLGQLPNGTYKLWLVPFAAAGDTAQLDIAVTGIKGKSGWTSALGGAMPLPVLVLLLGLGVLRLARKRA